MIEDVEEMLEVLVSLSVAGLGFLLAVALVFILVIELINEEKDR